MHTFNKSRISPPTKLLYWQIGSTVKDLFVYKKNTKLELSYLEYIFFIPSFLFILSFLLQIKALKF